MLIITYIEESKKKKLHPLLGYALQLQQNDINIVNSPNNVKLIVLFSAIIFPINYEFDPHILHVLCNVMWLYWDKESVILGSCFERLGASCFYCEHQDPYK